MRCRVCGQLREQSLIRPLMDGWRRMCRDSSEAPARCLHRGDTFCKPLTICSSLLLLLLLPHSSFSRAVDRAGEQTQWEQAAMVPVSTQQVNGFISVLFTETHLQRSQNDQWIQITPVHPFWDVNFHGQLLLSISRNKCGRRWMWGFIQSHTSENPPITRGSDPTNNAILTTTPMCIKLSSWSLSCSLDISD